MPIKRKKRFSLKLLGIFSLIFFLWGLSPLYAESLESMAVRAETIVVSVTKKKASYWDGDIIRTRATLDIKQVVAGSLEEKTVTVIYDGGVVDHIGLKVSHGVRLPEGQKTVLFLKKSGDYFTVINQRRGIFFVLPGPKGEIAVSAEAVHLPPPGLSVKSSRIISRPGEGVPLNNFISTLQEFKR